MSIKICYVAGREGTYSRTHNVRVALEREFEVVTCFPESKSMADYPKVLWQFLKKKKDCDAVVVGFYGQLLMPAVRLFTKKPILFDVYVSTFGTMVDDRGKAQASSLKAKLYWLADHCSMRFADHILLESNDHIRRYADLYRIPRAKFTRMFLPSDESIMVRRAAAPKNPRFLVHFHGEYAPFHGVDVIIRAAKALENEGIDFQIVGKGITYARDRQLATDLQVSNITFVDPVPYAKLAELMTRADVCLGFFGDNPRAERVFTNKVVEALAVGQPLITRRNDAVQELLEDEESALLIAPGDPEALAQAILRLKNDAELRDRLAKNGRKLYEAHCTQAVFASALKHTIEEMLAHAKSD